MKRHQRYIALCIKKAQKNNIKNYRHAAILVKSNRVLSVGLNRDKADCLIDPLYGKKGLHAELNVLRRLSDDQIRGSILYVAGLSKGNHIVKSKPCPHCQEYIKRFDLKAVYYSVPGGTYEKMII